MTKYFTSLILVFLIGCSTPKKDTYTYLGGKIINPKQRYLLLRNNEKVIDTIKLSKNNTFTGTFKNLKEGLYYFTHGDEFQFIYLEPKDSLLFRLNTWGFDESLVFSGKNATRNNLLIDAFLTEEKQRKKFYTYHKLSPKKFKAVTDSVLNVKNIQLQNYIDTNKEASKKFIEVAKIALNYPIYSEIESFIISNSLKEIEVKLDSSFFEHRKNTNLNKNSLMFYTPYNSYVFESLYSDVYYQKINRNSDEFTISLINNINKRIDDKKLRNKILKNTLVRHFLNKSSCNLNEQVFNNYYKSSTNNKDILKIKKLVNDAKKIKKTSKLPNFKLYNFKDKKYSIARLIKNRNTVIYFRNKKYSSNEWVATKINMLKQKFPNIQFLVVNLSKNSGFNNNLMFKEQFYLTKESKAQEFLTSKFPRAMLISKKGNIKNGFASLSSPKIIQQIKDLEN